MVLHPGLGSDLPIGSDRETGRDNGNLKYVVTNYLRIVANFLITTPKQS